MIFPLLLVLLFCRADSFVISNHGRKRNTCCTLSGFQFLKQNRKCCSAVNRYQSVFVVQSTSPDNEINEVLPNTSSTSNSPEIANQDSEEQKRAATIKTNAMSYPIDLPSPILLGASVALAISSIGR
jgi:hypothetical protein